MKFEERREQKRGKRKMLFISCRDRIIGGPAELEIIFGRDEIQAREERKRMERKGKAMSISSFNISVQGIVLGFCKYPTSFFTYISGGTKPLRMQYPAPFILPPSSLQREWSPGLHFCL